MRIGIRELRDSLSEQLAAVRRGHTVTITSHGQPVARLVPIDQPSSIERLRAAGMLRAPQSPRRPRPAPIKTSGTVSDLIDDQRR